MSAPDRSPKEQEALYRAFAKLYCDVSKPETYENAVACYKVLVDPNPPEWSLKKTPYRYLKNKVTQTEIAKIKVQTKTIVEELEGMTPAQFVHECLFNARLFAERGGLGDSTASAQMMKLVGTAIGALVTKTEDVTKRPALLLTAPEQLDQLLTEITRYKQLTAPPPELAEYSIEEESDGSTSTRTVALPDDGGRSPATGGGAMGREPANNRPGDVPTVPARVAAPDEPHDDGAPGHEAGAPLA